MKTITLRFDSELPDINIGTRVYTVVPDPRAHSAEYRAGCPICDDKKVVTIRGKEYPCPECRGMYATASAIRLTPYIVAEYIVNGLEAKGWDCKSDYPKNEKPVLHRVTYSAFYKYGRASNEYKSMHFTAWDISNRNDHGEIHLTKKEAKEACRKKHDEQKKKLDEFNKAHGTHYEYPFIF